MILWRMHLAGDGTSRGVYVPDEALDFSILTHVKMPSQLGKFLSRRGISDLELDVADTQGPLENLPDFFESDAKIFSEKGRSLVMDEGYTEADFYPAHFRTYPAFPLFMFTPSRVIDIIDLDKSVRTLTIPGGDPPFLLLLQLSIMVTKELPKDLPGIFHVLDPLSKMSSGVCVTEAFKRNWERMKLKGAGFTRLTSISH